MRNPYGGTGWDRYFGTQDNAVAARRETNVKVLEAETRMERAQRGIGDRARWETRRTRSSSGPRASRVLNNALLRENTKKTVVCEDARIGFSEREPDLTCMLDACPCVLFWSACC